MRELGNSDHDGYRNQMRREGQPMTMGNFIEYNYGGSNEIPELIEDDVPRELRGMPYRMWLMAQNVKRG